ncbi:hypothetical protein RAS1_18420 [Phycisphaerae bacterium RAS1]|nr:hypothetical protein RAS1_18420 [Phycisphaerae bacterium RAS1]
MWTKMLKTVAVCGVVLAAGTGCDEMGGALLGELGSFEESYSEESFFMDQSGDGSGGYQDSGSLNADIASNTAWINSGAGDWSSR